MKPLITQPILSTTRSSSTRSIPLALTSLSLIMLLSSLGTSIANVGLPEFALAFNTSFQSVQWIVIAYLLAVTVMVVTMGRLGDLVGRRRLLLIGLGLFMLASLGCGFARELWMLITARLAQGIGAATMMALTMAFVGDIVPKDKTGSAMGLLGTMSAVGTALGPSLGGMLIAGLGWPAIFLINLPLGLLAWGMAWNYLPEDKPTPERPRFDLPGTSLLAIALVFYTLGVTLGKGHFGWLNWALICMAALSTGLFVIVETKVSAPLIRLSLFRERALSAGFVSSTLIAAVIMTTLVVGPFYLTGAFGLDAVGVGLVMSAGPLVSALVGIPAGRIVDKFGTNSVGVVGACGMAAGAFLLSSIPVRYGVLGYLLPLMVMTASYAVFQVANNTSVMSTSALEQRGLVAGMLNLSRNLGLISGASAMGAVFIYGTGMVYPGSANAEAVIAGMRLTFGVAGLLILCALIVMWMSQRRTV